MRRRTRWIVAFVLFGLFLAGAIPVGRTLAGLFPDEFPASGTPTTIEVAPGESVRLLRHKPGTATCTVAPASGESRQVRVPFDDEEGFEEEVWWSGTATVTCDRDVTGAVLVEDVDQRLLIWMLLAVALLPVAGLGIAALTVPDPVVRPPRRPT